jgi:hypothetical protein
LHGVLASQRERTRPQLAQFVVVDRRLLDQLGKGFAFGRESRPSSSVARSARSSSLVSM